MLLNPTNAMGGLTINPLYGDIFPLKKRNFRYDFPKVHTKLVKVKAVWGQSDQKWS